jgi:hypothetical protein
MHTYINTYIHTPDKVAASLKYVSLDAPRTSWRELLIMAGFLLLLQAAKTNASLPVM